MGGGKIVLPEKAWALNTLVDAVKLYGSVVIVVAIVFAAIKGFMTISPEIGPLVQNMFGTFRDNRGLDVLLHAVTLIVAAVIAYRAGLRVRR